MAGGTLPSWPGGPVLPRTISSTGTTTRISAILSGRLLGMTIMAAVLPSSSQGTLQVVRVGLQYIVGSESIDRHLTDDDSRPAAGAALQDLEDISCGLRVQRTPFAQGTSFHSAFLIVRIG